MSSDGSVEAHLLNLAFPTGVVERTQLIQFLIPFPDRVGLSDGTLFTEHLDEVIPDLVGLPLKATEHDGFLIDSGNLFVSARIMQVRIKVNPLGTAYEALAPLLESVFQESRWWSRHRRLARALQRGRHGGGDLNGATVAGVVTALRGGADAESELAEALERCLDWLATLTSAYRIRKGIPIRVPTLESMPAIIPYALRTLDAGANWTGPFIYEVGWQPWELAAVTDAEPGEWLDPYLTGVSLGHPTANFLEHFVEAEVAARRDGDYRAGVVLLETAVEVLVNGLFGLLLWEKGASPIESRKEYAPRGSFKDRIQKVGTYLPGDWGVANDGPVSAWATKLAMLRHSVVHEGHRPSRAEMLGALEATKALQAHVRDSLLDADGFPKTKLMVVGLETARNSGKLSAEMEALAASKDEPDWLGDYLIWIRTIRDE